MGVIYLIRHGQASWGLGDYDRLSELGERQSAVLGKALRGRVESVDLVVSGEMRRHRRTAHFTMEALGADGSSADDDGGAVGRGGSAESHGAAGAGISAGAELEDRGWNEFDHEQVIAVHKPSYKSKTVMVADLTRRGDPRRAFQVMFDEALARWSGAGDDDAYAESWTSFVDRAHSALTRLDEQLGRKGTAMVFTSGGPISAVAARLLGVGAEGWMQLNRVIANASVTKVVSGRSGLSLVTFNDHSHFEGEGRGLLTYR
ncbi:MAG: histidine phosphatase family protein [Actinobacteria bacterium]|nr:histidine phosphatase family protein [Actinomycetota bacterium]